MPLEIKHRTTNKILYTYKYNSLENANLKGANLEGAIPYDEDFVKKWIPKGRA